MSVIHSLKGDRAFKRLRRGKAGHAKHLSLRWRPSPERGLYVGIVVSKKVGKAVTRNRVRRRLKEGLREVVRSSPEPDAWSVELLLIAKPEAAEADYGQLRGSLEHALRKGNVL